MCMKRAPLRGQACAFRANANRFCPSLTQLTVHCPSFFLLLLPLEPTLSPPASGMKKVKFNGNVGAFQDCHTMSKTTLEVLGTKNLNDSTIAARIAPNAGSQVIED